LSFSEANEVRAPSTSPSNNCFTNKDTCTARKERIDIHKCKRSSVCVFGRACKAACRRHEAAKRLNHASPAAYSLSVNRDDSRTSSGNKSPEFGTILKVMAALGLQMHIVVAKAS
jgi:hypothetical protein